MNASVCATGTLLMPLLVTGFAARPAYAQYTNPYTGRTFNNPNSSLLDTAILGIQNRMMLSSALASSGASSAALRAAYRKQMQDGESQIKSGKQRHALPAGRFRSTTG